MLVDLEYVDVVNAGGYLDLLGFDIEGPRPNSGKSLGDTGQTGDKEDPMAFHGEAKSV